MTTKISLTICLAAFLKFAGTAQCTFTTSIASAASLTTCGSNTLSVTSSTNWVQKTDFGGTARHSGVGFSIGAKGYIGTGQQGTLKNDFWEYDPATDVWTQKANFAGSARYLAVGFGVGSKGYVGLGWDGNGYKSDFYEYNPATNTWTSKASYPGGLREGAFCFNLGSLGYVGGGFGGSYANTFYEYNPSTNVWTQKANFGGGTRGRGIAFTVNGKAYAGMGTNGTFQSDLWEYNASTDVWTQKSSTGISARIGAAAFGLSTKGYLVTGHDGTSPLKDFYEYDPTTDVWTQKPDFPSAPRFKASGFAIGNHGYLGIGTETVEVTTFWKYTPDDQILWSTNQTNDSIVVINSGSYTVNITDADGCTATATIALIVNPNPTVTAANGTICAGNNFTIVPSGAGTYSFSSNSAVVSPVNTTTYAVFGISQQSCTSINPAIITVSVSSFPLPLIQINHGDTALCAGNSLVLAANGASTYTWNSGSTNGAITVTPSSLSTYSLTGTDVNNCYNFASITVSVNSLPNIQISISNPTICSGQNVDLNAVGAATYTWNGGATTSSISVTPTITSTYSLTGKDVNSCYNFATITVSVKPLPDVQISTATSTICTGESLQLTASGAATFDWGSQVTTSTLLISPAVSANYTVVGTDAEGCSKTASITVTVETCTGLKNSSAFVNHVFTVFPNPSNGEFKLVSKQSALLVITNMLAQPVMEMEVTNGENLIDLSKLPNGLYFASYKYATNTQVVRIIKQ